MKQGARDWYEDGVAEHYRAHGAAYRNPHAAIIGECVARATRDWTIDLTGVLDLAAGSGELTRAILSATPLATVAGCDPFTFEAYERETGLACERLTFEAIADGALRGRRYSLVGCSFAMHLCPASLLPQLTLELAQVAPRLLILTPHKRPALRDEWGFAPAGEFMYERVRTRLYASSIWVPSPPPVPSPGTPGEG